MAAKGDLRPKAGGSPETRKIRTGGDPESTDTQTVSWQFHRLDIPHKLWGWCKVDFAQWKNIVHEMQSIEGLTWGELKKQAGGRNHGTNHHYVEIEDLCKEARDRWSELRLDEFDGVFSLRLSNTLRIYGLRDGRSLQLIWCDPHHGNANGVWPFNNK